MQRTLEIIYVNVPDGVLTPKLHELKVGDKLQVMEKSVGFFTMSEVPDGKNLPRYLIQRLLGLGCVKWSQVSQALYLKSGQKEHLQLNKLRSVDVLIERWIKLVTKRGSWR